MNLHACPFLPTRVEDGTWHRAVRIAHQANPLATAHTSHTPGKFNPGTPADHAFEILYLAATAQIAEMEVQALLGFSYPGGILLPNPHGQWIVVPAVVHLQSIVDLSHHAYRQVLQTTVQELTGDWRGYMFRDPNRHRGG